ncbi:hypothetical protein RsTz2092_01800 [Deferribacterales bacterium RsTz2092]
MGKIDILFYGLGLFCYLSIMISLRDQSEKLAEYEEYFKKRAIYADRLVEQRRREAEARNVASRKSKNRLSAFSKENAAEAANGEATNEVAPDDTTGNSEL